MARILVIDDDPRIREVLAVGLANFGHTVSVAADAETGLACADGSSHDVVLLDVDLPRVSGLAVCEALRRDPARRHLPVLMMTGRATRQIHLLALKAGARVLLSKPFTWEELQGELMAASAAAATA